MLYLPFFLFAHCMALFLDYPADGFSIPYPDGHQLCEYLIHSNWVDLLEEIAT